ncbi:cytochrome c553 [Thioflavicoccus mobilis 8321]|uniref:Cytochrome c553 n=1 Tax=Thioflavicoccus mobilis 8321 TaxID=765912 RepID=L0GXC6_9GAMM|nr:c-type cytochrome [Thioflavicoccus mobilis]AGA90010.1 cytochrome c553 [Thioflavicoccus mobilis 8321]
MFEKRLAAAAAMCLAASCGISAAQTPAEVASAEYEEAMSLKPDVEKGRDVYLVCSVCHGPEGWGTPDGAYPQLAGQLQSVIVKQLTDIRAGLRPNPLMSPFAAPRILGSPQQVRDVAAYVSGLPMAPRNGLGPGQDLDQGAQLYGAYCAACHGAHGEGNAEERIPALVGQHYGYLMRQFDAIRRGRRSDSDHRMIEGPAGLSGHEQSTILDHASRLRPPAGKLANDGWHNPDFPPPLRAPAAGSQAPG